MADLLEKQLGLRVEKEKSYSQNTERSILYGSPVRKLFIVDESIISCVQTRWMLFALIKWHSFVEN